MVRYRRVHLDAAGGCHLDRSIDRLIRDAGFHIVALERVFERSASDDLHLQGIQVLFLR